MHFLAQVLLNELWNKRLLVPWSSSDDSRWLDLMRNRQCVLLFGVWINWWIICQPCRIFSTCVNSSRAKKLRVRLCQKLSIKLTRPLMSWGGVLSVEVFFSFSHEVVDFWLFVILYSILALIGIIKITVIDIKTGWNCINIILVAKIKVAHKLSLINWSTAKTISILNFHSTANYWR